MSLWSKLYARIKWKNGSEEKSTPLGKTLLNRMDIAIDELDNRVLSLSNTKLDAEEALSLVQDVTYQDGKITVIKKDKTTKVYSLNLEKVVINITYNKATQHLILTLSDNTVEEISLADFITEYEFLDTDTIDVTVENGRVSAIVKDGSITEDKLQPNYLSDVKLQVEHATIQAALAAEQAELSKKWAVGETEQDTTNSKYYSEQAREYAKQAQEAGNISIATTTVAGIVKPDGETITVESDGTIKSKWQRITRKEYPLTTNNWVGEVSPFSYTLNCELSKGENTMLTIGVDNLTLEQMDAFLAAKMIRLEQQTNAITLYAYGEKPLIDLSIIVESKGESV